MPKISVLIPAYNVEKYIVRCLNSVLSQSFSDIEVIIVKDGSTDGTAAIIEEYVANDSRIRVIDHSENCGLLWVRKTGIEASSGDYLMFVDSDDELKPEACRRLYSAAESTGADLVIGRHDYIEISGLVQHKSNELKYGCSAYGVAKAMAMDDLNRYMWGKLYKRELFTEHPISYFKHLNIGEDQIISYQIARYVEKAVCIPDILYNYYRNSSSLIYNFKSEKDIRDLMFTDEFTIRVAGEIGIEIKELIKIYTTRRIFNCIKKGCGRARVMNLAEEYGLSYLFSVPSLLRYMGFKKALIYYPVTRFDFVSRLLYGRKWNNACHA